MSDTLHLVKVPLQPGRMAAIARRKHMPLHELDEGYVAHCAMRELWGDAAPTPFLLHPRGRMLEAWGYSRCPAEALIDVAQSTPLEQRTWLEDPAAVVGRPMPRFPPGQRVGFHLRACPVVRLVAPTNGHRAGAEVDAFLARCFCVGPNVAVSREEVYSEWITGRLGDEQVVGARLDAVRIAAMVRDRVVRRSHGAVRQARRLERPDVRFEGTLVVTEAERFLACLAHGIGRHRAFGFGALMLVPPGTCWER